MLRSQLVNQANRAPPSGACCCSSLHDSKTPSSHSDFAVMADTQRPRKRDWLKNLVTKPSDRSPGPEPSACATAVPAPEPPSAPEPAPLLGKRLLEATLEKLTGEERDLVQKYITKDADDINVVIDQSHRAALDKKEAYADKSWQWTFRGKKIVLRDEAEKIINCLNMLRPVGNAVAEIDPIHVGLPWAGISALLQVITANYVQMAALLKGMTLILSTINRLRAYFRYCERLPRDLTTTNFEEALVELYAHVLRFMSSAIQTYERNVVAQMFHALIKTTSLESFEVKCDQLGSLADAAAANCDRLLSSQDRERARQTKEELDRTLSKLRDLQNLKEVVGTLNVKVELQRLKTAAGATFDSYEDEHAASCLEGTRVELLSQVSSWASDPNGKRIFWLCGKAGTGKSTIARTVGRLLSDSGLLGASFFFKRGAGARADAGCFFPTIVRQLVDKFPEASQGVADALEANSFLCDQSLQQQCEKLLSQPFATVVQQQATSPLNFVILVDALDECEREDHIGMLLRLLSKTGTTGALSLRIFVTSRPEVPVRIGFKTEVAGTLHKDVMLEEVQATTIEQDIRMYFDYRFAEIRKTSSAIGLEALPLGWPGSDKVETLVSLARPLFIFAFTICRYVAEGDPVERLETILNEGPCSSISGLAKVYLPILQQTISDQDARHDFHEIVGAVVVLAEPLSAASLSILLEVSMGRVRVLLSRLHSLLSVSDHGPIMPLHLSFRDFLVNFGQGAVGASADEFRVDEKQTHARLARQCLRHLERPGVLKQDICSFGKPGIERLQVDKEDIANHIPADTAYACSYWAWHVSKSEQSLSDGDRVHQFVQCHFLHWLEALSWLGRLSSVFAYIGELRSLVTVETGSDIAAFLDDALRFVSRNRYVIDLAPLQAYHSAMIFAPSQSIVRRACEEQVPSLWATLPQVPVRWDAKILKLEGPFRSTYSIAFSPDARTIAATSDDGNIRLWNTQTGEQIYQLEGHDGPLWEVAFSRHGRLASGSDDRSVRLWNTRTGEQTHKLEGHTDAVRAVAFSPDGQIVVSGSDDRTARVWDVHTGKVMYEHIGHDNGIRSVACSVDGMIASASVDGTVQLWSAQAEKQTTVLQWCETRAKSVEFSPDGQTLAIVSYNDIVRLWNPHAHKQMQRLYTHGWNLGVAFSQDGKVLASVTEERLKLWDVLAGFKLIGYGEFGRGFPPRVVAFSPTERQLLATATMQQPVQLWETQTMLEPTQKLEKHDDPISAVVFSGVGRLVASAGFDGRVCLWDPDTGKMTKTLGHRDSTVMAVAFSPDALRIASVYRPGTVCLWDVQTGDRTRIHGLSLERRTIPLLTSFLANGQLLAVATVPFPDNSSDNTARVTHLWNVQTGENVPTTEDIWLVRDSDGSCRVTPAAGPNSLQPNAENPERIGAVLSLRPHESWMKCHGENLLWLPEECRVPNTSMLAVRGKTIVLGSTSGDLLFYRLR